MAYDIIVGRDEADKKAFESRGLVSIGKGYVKMGQYTSLSNNIFMDVARSHVLLVAGKRGSGKCLHKDTLITLSDGSQIPIKDLEKNKEKIISLNNKFKIEKSEKSEFFSRKVKRLIKLKLRSGKEIKLTPEHPLLTIKGWKPVENLTIGSRIATPRKIPSFGKEELPKYEIKLLSYLLAGGHTKKVVLFSNSDKKIVDDFKDSLKKIDPNLELVKDMENHYKIIHPNWANKIIEHDEKRNKKAHFIKGSKNIHKKRSIRKLIEKEKMFGLFTPKKYISQKIMKLNKKNLSIFLNRLFSCNGSIYKVNNYWEISYSSSSKKLINQVHSLLLRFGILSKIRNKRIKNKNKIFKSYEVVINAENSVKFIDKIGFFGEKEKKQKLAKKEILSKIRNPNLDTIPKKIWQTYKPKNWAEIGRVLGYKYPKAMKERIRYSPSRQTLLQISKVEQHKGLKLLAQSDIFWDEIISMEILDGNFKVYDICVPRNHNFVANDIIVHNSYTLGVIAEELSNLPPEARENIGSLIFDTMGIYWTMKYKNEKDKTLLQEWNLKPQNLPIKIFVPFGHYQTYLNKGIPVDKSFSLDVTELNAEDWILTFGLDIIEPVSVLIQKIYTDLKQSKNEFFIEDIIEKIKEDKSSEKQVKNATIALFEAAKTWGIFSEKGQEPTKVEELINAGTTSILDLSVYNAVGSFNIRALVISLVSRKIFRQRMSARKEEETKAIGKGLDYLSGIEKREYPLTWIFIDEAHEFLPLKGKTLATDALIQLLREGRQPGISLVLATQQPGQIHRDVMTQSDIIISHRVTSKPDLEALNYIMQSYVLEGIKNKMNDLPSLKGSAIILDDNSERIYAMRMRPRFTWHGGEAPTSVSKKKSL